MQKIKELAPNEPTAENKLVAFQQKIATLDLEIALTQNLFDSLRSAKANIPRNIT